MPTPEPTVETQDDAPVPPSTVAAAPTAAQDSGAILAESTGAEPALTIVAPETAQAREPRSTAGDGDTSAVENQATKSLTVEEPTPVSETAEPTVFDEGGEGATSIWWRVLEAVAGVLAVAFLAGLALRRRANRRDLA